MPMKPSCSRGASSEMQPYHAQVEVNKILQWLLEQDVHLPLQDMHLPSHFPYNPNFSARRIDYVAARHVRVAQASVGCARTGPRPTTNPSWPLPSCPFQIGLKLGLSGAPANSNQSANSFLIRSNLTGATPIEPCLNCRPPSLSLLKDRLSSRKVEPLSCSAVKLGASPLGLIAGEGGKLLPVNSSKKGKPGKQIWPAKQALTTGMHCAHSKPKVPRPTGQLPSWTTRTGQTASAGTCHPSFASSRQVSLGTAMQAMREEATHMCKASPWRPFTEQEMRLTMAKWKKPQSHWT